MASFKSLHGSHWPWKRKTSGTSHRDSEPFVEKGPIGALLRLKTSHTWPFKHRVWVIKVKTKNIEKYQRFTRLNGGKREKFGRIKSTGEPDAVEWFWKTVSLVRWTIFLFAIYVVIEILTFSGVIDNNREREVFQIPVVKV